MFAAASPVEIGIFPHHRIPFVCKRLTIFSKRPTQMTNLRFVMSTNGYGIVCANLQQKVVRIDPAAYPD